MPIGQMKTKVCTKCKKEKELTEFHKRKRSKDGLHSWCKECAIQIRINHYYKNKKHSHDVNNEFRKRNKERVIEYLSNHPCVDCGESDPIVLEFDHVSGKKEFNISTKYGALSWENILKEIEKCEVRCANCHRKRHHYASLAQRSEQLAYIQ